MGCGSTWPLGHPQITPPQIVIEPLNQTGAAPVPATTWSPALSSCAGSRSWVTLAGCPRLGVLTGSQCLLLASQQEPSHPQSLPPAPSVLQRHQSNGPKSHRFPIMTPYSSQGEVDSPQLASKALRNLTLVHLFSLSRGSVCPELSYLSALASL